MSIAELINSGPKNAPIIEPYDIKSSVLRPVSIPKALIVACLASGDRAPLIKSPIRDPAKPAIAAFLPKIDPYKAVDVAPDRLFDMVFFVD